MKSKISMLNQIKIVIYKNMTSMLEPKTLLHRWSAGVKVSTIFPTLLLLINYNL